MRALLLVLLVASLGIASGCSYSQSKDTPAPTDGNGASGQPDPGNGNNGSGNAPGNGETLDTRLSFANVLSTSIQTSCFPCHASPRNAHGINLETYASVFAVRSRVESAVSSRFMPDAMGGSMPDDRRNLLIEWLKAGAPEKGVVVKTKPQPAEKIASDDIVFDDLTADRGDDASDELAAVVGGCRPADFVAVEGDAKVVTQGLSYSPRCLRIHAGRSVTIAASGVHPLAPVPTPGNPIAPSNSPRTIVFRDAGTFGYFCANHGDATGAGMAGAIQVVP